MLLISTVYGEKRISDLSVFPTTFMQDQDQAKKELIKRGNRYHRTICGEKRHMKYNGLVIAEKPYYVNMEVVMIHYSANTLPSIKAILSSTTGVTNLKW